MLPIEKIVAPIAGRRRRSICTPQTCWSRSTSGGLGGGDSGNRVIG